MNDRLDFMVTGLPIPQGSMVARLVKGRPTVVHRDGPELKAWRKKIAAIARVHMQFRRPWASQAPVAVSLLFEIERGKTVTRPRPSVVPDIDKLARAALDALTEARVWGDDAQVVDLHVHEFYSPTPGVRVQVRDADLGTPQRQGERTNP